MTGPASIRRVRAGDDRLLREVRLRALATDPGAFGSTDTEVASRPRAFWRTWAAEHATGEDHCTLLALLDGRAVGLIRIEREPARPGVFGIYSMWVAPEARRRGIALELLAEAERWIESVGGTEAELNVVDREAPARSLYEQAGFQLDGRTEPATPLGAVELGMRKRLRTIPG
ncbi:MAG: GNAT family N-acetyltransferase [Gaiellales bacterium]